MFRHIAAFEFRYQLRSPVFWVTTLFFALLTFGAITSDNVQIGSAGNVKKNSPYAIAQTLQIMSMFAVFIMAAFVSNVVVRDDETGYGPIVHSTRVSTFDYLFGRFTGAFVAGCLAFLACRWRCCRLVHAVDRSRDARAVAAWRLCCTSTSCSACRRCW